MEDKVNEKLVVRQAVKDDTPYIRELCQKVYPEMIPYSIDLLKAQQQNFPDGQFVAVMGGRIVGYCATIRVKGEKALHAHTWHEITGGGYGASHDPHGDYLYGMEIFVDPDVRGLRIGQRLYAARRDLCRRLRLQGIVFAGRMPLLSKRIKKVGTPEVYLKEVLDKRIKDPVINFQLRNGFDIIGILKNYLPYDKDSLGCAVHMVWKNTRAHENKSRGREVPRKRVSDSIRIASVQYMQRGISSFDEFVSIVHYFIDVVSDYRADFVVFPEMFALQLLSIENEQISPDAAIAKLTDYTPRIREFFSKAALKYNVNIIAGSHPTREDDGSIQNIAYVFLRDGTEKSQPKIHPTPNERYWWRVKGGDRLSVIDTDCGPIGVLICYDSEFPELARHLVDQGALILFVPFCTDERQSYLRVRYCCQARAVENQVYVALSGNVGNLPRVHNMDIQYAQSCILTPCDFPFSRDGIAADTTPNVEMVAFADLRLEDLLNARQSGTVLNLRDRRSDLYSVAWRGQ